jgi:hypothetical protein
MALSFLSPPSPGQRPQLARGAQFAGFLGFARFLQRVDPFGKLLPVAETCSDFGPRLEIVRVGSDFCESFS